MSGRIYADHAATTPTHPAVVDAMTAYLRGGAFNPSSQHAEGRRAKAALDDARERTAHALGVAAREIVFTGSGTEANALALYGAARARSGAGRRIVSVATEHRAVLLALDALAEDGFDVELLPVDRDGRVDVAAFAAALTPGTTLASVMTVNNELGTIQPIAALAATARDRGVLFHTDAIQAPGGLSLRGALGADLMSLSAHKFYGPHGVGALYVRAGTPLVPQIVGGSQEFGIRAGTENVAGAIGLATALELATHEQPLEAARLGGLRDRFEATLAQRVPSVRVNASGAPRAPHISSLTFPGTSARELAILLDLEGVAVSTGSACASGAARPSHVLRAAGVTDAEATLRFSLGRSTGRQEVDALLEMLPEVVASVRVEAASVGTSQPARGRAARRDSLDS